MSALSEVGGLARRADPDRFLCALWLPPPAREAMFALIAWNAEIARAREVASQPMIGLIRLQWWRETVEAALEGGLRRAHEVAGPLHDVIRTHRLPAETFERAIRAREAAIEEEPPGDLDALALRARDEAAPLFELGLALLGERRLDAIAEDAGEAYGLVGLLRSTAHLAARGETLLPLESGADVADEAARRRAASLVASRAEEALRRAREQAPAVTQGARPALLPLVLARASLARLRRSGFEPLAETAVRRGTRDRLALLWAGTTGRI